MASYPQLFWFIYVQGQLEEQSWMFWTKLTGPIFLDRHVVKIPLRANVKLKKLMLRAESKLRAIFSADFTSLHREKIVNKKFDRAVF